MKRKFTILTAAFMLLAFLAVPLGMRGQTRTTTTLFQETFDQCAGTGGNDGSWSGTIASSTLTPDNTGWTFANEGGAYQCAKFGTGSKKGSAETPSITLSGNATLSFKAAAWNSGSEQTQLNLSAAGGTLKLNGSTVSSVTMVKGQWTTYTLEVTDVTTSVKIKFEGKNASNSRFFLDEVVVSQEVSSNPTCTIDPTSWNFGEVLVGSSEQTKQFTVTASNLTHGLSFSLQDSEYYLIDVYGMGSSETSKTITVTLYPTEVGPMNDVLVISGEDFAEDIEVNLTATGTCTSPTTPLAFVTPVNLTLTGTTADYTLTPTGAGNGGAITYSLKSGDANHGVLVDDEFSADAVGTYVITATQALNGSTCGDSFDITINVVGTAPVCTIDPTVYEFGTVLTGSTQSTTFTVTTANLTGDLTVAIDNTDEGFSVSPTTIAQSATSTTVTVTYAPISSSDEIYAELSISGGGLSAATTAMITGTASTGNTITFEAGTGSCATPSITDLAGTVISLPTAIPPTACAADGWTFAGWSTTSVNETTSAPTLLTGNYTITESRTLYAVYKVTTGGSTNTDNVFDHGTYDGDAKTITWAISGVVSILQERNGSGNSEPNSSYVSNPRWYSGNKITISPSVSINSITVTANTDGYATALANSTYTNATATANSSTATITPTNGSNTITIVMGGQCRMSSLVVNYGGSTDTYDSNPSCLETVATPTFDPAAGSYTSVQSVEISCTTVDATIYYTTDGTVPTTASTLYTSAIEVSESKTIKAIAVKDGMNNSAVAEAAYVIDFPDVAAPTFTPASGTTFFTEGITVTITCSTDGANIYYTLDGTAPTSASTLYNAPISLSSTTTIKAIATKSGMDNSSVVTAKYIYSDPNGLGTRSNPYTVAQAKELMSGWSVDATSSADVYVSGIICSVDSYNSSYKSITYCISDDGGTTSKIKVYGGKGLGGDDFSSKDDLSVNDQVIVKGQLLKYSATVDEINTNSIQVFYSYMYGTNNENIDCYRVIEGYGSNAGGYYLVASPVEMAPNYVDPDNSSYTVGMITDDGTDPENYSYDLYSFDQSETLEWRNYRQETFNIVPGNGYLYANKDGVTINFWGEPTTNTYTTLTKTTDAKFEGWNLVGNPLSTKAYINNRPFYIMNSEGTELLVSPRNYIMPMESVFVNANSNGETLNFSATAPDANPGKGNLNIQVAQVVATRSAAHFIDRAVVCFSENGMLPKFMLNPDNTKLYIPQGNKDYAVVRGEARGEMPVNFKAAENSTYTINVEAENLEVNYLHLIDNLTGMDVDLLATPSYTFEARKSDIASRFRLVFDANAGNNEANEEFAFISDGDIIVNGTGTVQVIDILGRQMFSHEVNSAFRIQNSEFAPGVYVLRLVNGNDVKTQKIVIK